MAKEARRIIPEEEGEARARDLITGSFVESTPFIEVFENADITLSQGESMGIATAGLFMQVLDLNGIGDKDERRKIATAATGQIINGGVRDNDNRNLFKNVLGTGVDIQIGVLEDGKTTIYYRKDLSLDEASRRHNVIKTLLETTLEEKRRPEIEKRARAEEAKRKKVESERLARLEEERKPSSLIFVVLAYHKDAPQGEKDQYIVSMREKIAALEDDEDSTRKKQPIVEILPDPTERITDNSARVLSAADIASIFQRGLSESELDALLPSIRSEFVRVAKGIESSAGAAAQGLYESAKVAVKKPGRDIFRAFLAKRGIAPALMWQILARGDEQIGLRVSINDYDYPPYPDFLLQIWHERHIITNLTDHKDTLRRLAAEGNTVALFLDTVSEDENTWSGVVKKLVVDGEIDINGRVITQGDVDAILAPLVLTDDFILKAVFADLVGTMLSVPYGVYGKMRETAFMSLRTIVDQFSIPEIKQLIRQIDRGQVAKSVAGLKDPIASGIHGAIMQRVSLHDLNPRDYEGGMSAKAYGVMRARRGRNQYLPQPNPANYEGGEDSEAFKLASRLSEDYRFISPSEYGIKVSPGERIRMRQEPESLITEHLRK